MVSGKRYVFLAKEAVFAFTKSSGIGANYAGTMQDAFMENKKAGALNAVEWGLACMARCAAGALSAPKYFQMRVNVHFRQ